MIALISSELNDDFGPAVIEGDVDALVVSEETSKKGDILKFVLGESDDSVSGHVMSRAGKAHGKYSTWWNIQNTDTGNSNSFDCSQFKSIEKITVDIPENPVEQAFVVQIPRHLHNAPRCLEAKEKELACWVEFS